MARKAFVFLNGHFHKNDHKLIDRLLHEGKSIPLMIAVDGGLKFMQKFDFALDYWITDLDSSPKVEKDFLRNTEILIHPSAKDQTDGELALEFCLQRNVTDITFFGWYDLRCETDHMLGNLMLFHRLTKRQANCRLRFMDSAQEICPLYNQNLTLNGYKGRRLSIVPLDKTITLTLKGTEYPAEELVVRRGQTIALRNRISAKRASIRLKGAALAIIGDK
ncbi:MAG: thiamine diphosphokinase [FCB group bacterium]|nr:thiamine diphosphokinase [FCB group bacterium]